MKVNLKRFLSELKTESVSIVGVNKAHALMLVVQDAFLFLPQIWWGCREKRRELPQMELIDRDFIDSFDAYPDDMGEHYRKRLVANLKAIQQICEEKGIEEIYYSTDTPSEVRRAEAKSGAIVVYDEICVCTEEEAQAFVLHEWSHIVHGDGNTRWALGMAAAVARLGLIWASPLAFCAASPLMSYGLTKFVQRCERRADREAVEMMGQGKPLANACLKEAETVTSRLIQHIEETSPDSYCTLANYQALDRKGKLSVIAKVAELGIRDLTKPTFDHPSYWDRYIACI